MIQIKYKSLLKAASLTFLIVAVMIGCLLVIETPTAIAKAQDTYAIYLSPGPSAGLPYGGYHVTIAGFQNKQFTTTMKNEVIAAWTKVNAGKPYNFLNTGGKFRLINHQLGYGFYFKSKVLNALSTELRKSKDIKGVKYGNWHVTLYQKNAVSAAFLFETLDQLPWTLWEVRKHTDSNGVVTYHWTKII